MKTKLLINKKSLFLIAFLLVTSSLKSYGQSYLPITGGILTGSLVMASPTQIQGSYYGLNQPASQPSTSANVAIFANNTSGAMDIVGWYNGWHFVPVGTGAYPLPVLTLDNNGNTTMTGGLTAKSAYIYNAGAATVLGIGSGITGKTMLQLGTSSDAGGYGSIQSVSAQGSAWGNIVLNSGGGNVLVGKTSQANTSYKLDVNGNVRANQVVINTTGADFVFAPNYRLNSLANVKKYIDKNHHLPEIASAKEMQTNGLNVGENQTKLLQKVEELTLYLIKKDDELKKQQDEITLLKQQVQLLIKAAKK